MRGVIAILMLVVMVMVVVKFNGISSLVGESLKKASQLLVGSGWDVGGVLRFGGIYSGGGGESRGRAALPKHRHRHRGRIGRRA